MQRELDVVANNVANIGTNGLQGPVDALFRIHDAEGERGRVLRAGPAALLRRSTTGTGLDFASGPLERTGNPLDIAISGNGVLAVQTAKGERYTRNGSLQINSKGELVTSDGYPVLGDGRSHHLHPQETDIEIGKDGTISTSQGEKGKLKLMHRSREPEPARERRLQRLHARRTPLRRRHRRDRVEVRRGRALQREAPSAR